MRRRPQVKVRDPVLRAQVFEIQPHGRSSRGVPSRHVDRRQFAAERFDHDIGDLKRVAGVRRRMPVLDHHARRALAVERGIDRGAERMKGLEVVDEQPHLPVVLARQLAREPPADADIAEIVDDSAENIARDAGGWSAGVDAGVAGNSRQLFR
jgi:hypothetical protein